jgi:F-type H+-transporting ATPase subunit a
VLATGVVLFFPFFLLLTLSSENAGVTNVTYFLYRGIADLIRNILLTNVPLKTFSMFRFIFFIFLVIFTANLLGLNPLFFATTAAFVFPLLLSGTYFIGINFLLVWQAGFTFVQFFIPSGLPVLIVPLI